MPKTADILKQQFTQSLGLPWSDILPATRFEQILTEEAISYRKKLYTPIVTVWAMVHQVLCSDKSLSNTVKTIITWLTAAGVEPPSSDTGAYAKARARLPEKLLQRLIPEVCDQLESQVPPQHCWCGHHVKAFDGTTLLLADSEANQEEYPQHANQCQGCGFPLARVVVFFSWLTGAVAAASIASKHTSEIEMSRELYQDLDPGDVAIADQAFGSYVDLALIQAQGADGVLRKRSARKTDFRKGQKNGIGDHQVQWHKPKQCPACMSTEEFAAIPETLNVREVRLRLTRKGFRDQFIVVVTTLLDAQRYSANQLTILYGWRWQATEVNLRHLKTTLKMEMLTAKTPAMARKDLWAHLLAYNLLRTVMMQAASRAREDYRHLSLQGTRQSLRSMLTLLAVGSQAVRKRLYNHLLDDIASDKLPVRPHRQEPRVVKLRPKPFPRMTQPRSVLKAKQAA